MKKLVGENGFCERIPEQGLDLRAEFHSPEIVRIVKTPAGAPVGTERSFSVVSSPDATRVVVKETPETISASSEAMTVVLTRATGSLRFLRADGTEFLAETPQEPTTFVRTCYASGETFRIRQAFRLDEREAIYGFGQQQNGRLSQRAEQILLLQDNRFVCMPLFQSVKGYGVFLDNPAVARFDGAHRYGAVFDFEAGERMDYYVMFGGSTDGVVRLIRKLTGAAPMHPLWAFGFWQSRERYKSQEELLDVLRAYRERRIPIDGIVQDWQYWSEDPYYWNAMEFGNPGFPDPKGMLDEIHRRKAHCMISIWASFGVKTKPYAAMKEIGAILPIGTFPSDMSCKEIKNSPYDPFNDKARALYWDFLNRNIFSLGMDAWWMDSTEPDHNPVLPSDFDLPTAEGPFRNVRNAFPLATTSGVHQRQRAATSEKRVFILTRSAFVGQQRNATNVWSGDTVASWQALREQIPAGLSLSLCGIPFWNSDIGGFFLWNYGGAEAIRNPAFHELYVRWMQFGAFCPMMRSHGMDAPRELHLYGKEGEPVYDALVSAIRLRYCFLPYIYSTMRQVHAEGASFMRPLVADYADDPATHDCATEYLFGRSVLVAPVLSSMHLKDGCLDADSVGVMDVRLPKGGTFFDFWSGRREEGGRIIAREVAFDVIPLYLKAGTILPFADVMEYAQEKSWSDLEIRICPGADGSFVLYEDEGDGYGFEQGELSMIPMSWSNAERTLTIGARQGAYPGMLETRVFRIVLVSEGRGVGRNRCAEPDVSVIYDGKELIVSL